MKLNFHLYSAHMKCRYCRYMMFRPVKMDSTEKINYCDIISSEVELDYYCDFYIQKKLEVEEIVKLQIKKLL